MKVRELVAALQGLDQDREIHILYDGYALVEPEVTEVAGDTAGRAAGAAEGDYVFDVC